MPRSMAAPARAISAASMPRRLPAMDVRSPPSSQYRRYRPCTSRPRLWVDRRARLRIKTTRWEAQEAWIYQGYGATPRLERTAMAYVLAGGRGSRLVELTDRRAKPAVYFGGKSRI